MSPSNESPLDMRTPIGPPPANVPASKINFVRQQGLRESSAGTCAVQYPAMMFQPRVLGALVLTGVLTSAWWLFLLLGAVLWFNTILPAHNPFDAIYNGLVAGPRNKARLEPAPAPRRFAQALGGTVLLIIGFALRFGHPLLAGVFEGLMLAALVALVFGRFCVSSYLFHLLRRDRAFAQRTAPWAHGA